MNNKQYHIMSSNISQKTIQGTICVMTNLVFFMIFPIFYNFYNVLNKVVGAGEYNYQVH